MLKGVFKLSIVSFITMSIVVSCSIKKSFIAQKATYENWIGGQPEVGGTKYVFTVVGKYLDNVKLDSIYINNRKVASFESYFKKDTIIYTVNKIDYFKSRSIDGSDMSINIRNKTEPKLAYLYFNDSKNNVIALKFDSIKMKKTVFYK